MTTWAASVLAIKLSRSASPARRPFSAMFSNSPTGLTLGMNLRVKMLLRVLGMLRMAPLMARGGSDKFSRGRAIRRTPALTLSLLFSASFGSSVCNTDRLSSKASAISGLRIFFRLGLANSSKILANWSGSMESSLAPEDEELLLPPEDGVLVRL